MISFNKDFLEFARELNNHKVEYMIVGAYAMAAHGYSRATGDIDFYVRPNKINAKNLYNALKNFGAYLHETSMEDFSKDNFVLQIGVAPLRIDILTSISGVSFDEAYSQRIEREVEGLALSFLSREFLIINKKATGREKDLHDAKELEELRNENEE
jgi:hypothetical protein